LVAGCTRLVVAARFDITRASTEASILRNGLRRGHCSREETAEDADPTSPGVAGCRQADYASWLLACFMHISGYFAACFIKITPHGVDCLRPLRPRGGTAEKQINRLGLIARLSETGGRKSPFAKQRLPPWRAEPNCRRRVLRGAKRLPRWAWMKEAVAAGYKGGWRGSKVTPKRIAEQQADGPVFLTRLWLQTLRLLPGPRLPV